MPLSESVLEEMPVKKNRMHIIAIVLLLVFTLCSGSSYGLIKAKYAKIMEVAYMNGFIDGVGRDLDEIKKIKADPSLLEEVVKQAAERYIQKVYELNQNK
jgi:hypothetical protein